VGGGGKSARLHSGEAASAKLVPAYLRAAITQLDSQMAARTRSVKRGIRGCPNPDGDPRRCSGAFGPGKGGESNNKRSVPGRPRMRATPNKTAARFGGYVLSRVDAAMAESGWRAGTWGPSGRNSDSLPWPSGVTLTFHWLWRILQRRVQHGNLDGPSVQPWKSTGTKLSRRWVCFQELSRFCRTIFGTWRRGEPYR